MRPTDKELLLGVADALTALAGELEPSERRVQLELAAKIVRQVGSRLGQSRAIVVADCEDLVATLAELGAPVTPPEGLADLADEELQELHDRLQARMVEAQRAVPMDGGAPERAIRAFHRRSLERRAALDHPFSRS